MTFLGGGEGVNKVYNRGIMKVVIKLVTFYADERTRGASETRMKRVKLKSSDNLMDLEIEKKINTSIIFLENF